MTGFTVSRGTRLSVIRKWAPNASQSECSLSSTYGKRTAGFVLAAMPAIRPLCVVGASPSDHLFVSIDLGQLRLKDLGNVRITTVSRKTESLSGAAVAIHVVTQENIRPTQVTSLADMFRRVPSLVVSQAISRQRVIT